MRGRLSSISTANPAILCPIAGHNSQQIISYCCSPDCMTPLCQECIQIHSEYHEDISEPFNPKPLREVKSTAVGNIKEVSTLAQTKLKTLHENLRQHEEETRNDLAKLSRCRGSLISVINKLFDELEREYMKVSADEKKLKNASVNRITAEFSAFLTHLQKEEQNIETDTSLVSLREIHERNLDGEVNEILTKNSAYELETKLCRIITNSNLVASVTKQIRDHVKLDLGEACDLLPYTDIVIPTHHTVNLGKLSICSPHQTAKQELRDSDDLARMDSTREKLSEDMRTVLNSGTLRVRQSTDDVENASGFLSRSGGLGRHNSTEGRESGSRDWGNKNLLSGIQGSLVESSTTKKVEERKIPEAAHSEDSKGEHEDYDGGSADEEGNKDDVLTQKTEYDSEYTSYKVKDLDEDEEDDNRSRRSLMEDEGLEQAHRRNSDRLSSVMSAHSENVVFEEVLNDSPDEKDFKINRR